MWKAFFPFERLIMTLRTLAASAVIALSASLLPACSTTSSTQPGVVGVDREQRFLVSSEQINQASEQAYAQVMADAQKKGVLNRDPAHVQRVRAITQRLIPAS